MLLQRGTIVCVCDKAGFKEETHRSPLPMGSQSSCPYHTHFLSSKQCANIFMLNEKCYCIISESFSFLIPVISLFLPQFPKNNNNSRMPSVNIIEVWRPGCFLFIQDFVFSRTSRAAFKPICLSGWGWDSGAPGRCILSSGTGNWHWNVLSCRTTLERSQLGRFGCRVRRGVTAGGLQRLQIDIWNITAVPWGSRGQGQLAPTVENL